MRRMVVLLCALAGATVAIGGCGASQVIDPVAKAASTTLGTGGYKMSAVMTVTGGPTPVSAVMTGAIDGTNDSGVMTIDESVGGQRVHAPVVFSQLNFWMKASAVPGAAQRAGGKPWIYVDMSKALGAMGAGSLTSSVNPSQFLNYLGTVGPAPTRVGTVMIHTVRTTEYRATINLDRYAQQNHVPAKTVSTLESAIGSHSMPIEAWIDSKHLVRRIHIAFPECVARTKLQFSMTIGIYGFGTLPQVQIPARGSVYNLTPLLATESRTLRPGGC